VADVTRCKHADTGHEAEIPTPALAAWQRLGWEPISDSRSLDEAEQERIDAENAAAERVQAVVEDLTAGDKRPTVAQVLEEVGDDPDAARAALDIEQADPNPRSTLVAGLTQIIDTAGDAGNHQED
jgi:hypothetical protein